MKRLAVLYDENENLAEFYHCCGYAIYEIKDGQIIKIRKADFEQIKGQTILEIRYKVNNLVEELNDCRIIAVESILGIPYSVFDKAGYYIFQINEYTYENILKIFEDLDEFKRLKQKETNNKMKPEETNVPGVYKFDLVFAQEKNPELSSKKALQPFFEATSFSELKLKCTHVPAWLLKDERFSIYSEKNGEGHTAFIKPKGLERDFYDELPCDRC